MRTWTVAVSATVVAIGLPTAAYAGPDSASISPPPVGNAQLRATYAETSNRSSSSGYANNAGSIGGQDLNWVLNNGRYAVNAGTANGVSSAATIAGSQIVGTVSSANTAFTAAYATAATTADNLSNVGTIDGSRITGMIDGSRIAGKVAAAASADKSVQLYNNWTGQYDYASNLHVNAADVSTTAETAVRSYNVYDGRTGTFQWVNNVRVAEADHSRISDMLFDNYAGGYNWASNLHVGISTWTQNNAAYNAGFIAPGGVPGW